MTHGMSFALGNIHMFVRGRPLRFAVGPGQPATPPPAPGPPAGLPRLPLPLLQRHPSVWPFLVGQQSHSR